jgi:hypothetical protein
MWKLGTFAGVMIFYAILSYIVFPLFAYYVFDKSLVGAGNGFVVGSIVSIVLWLTVGKSLVRS